MSKSVFIPIHPHGQTRDLDGGECESCNLQEFSVLQALRLADDMRQTAQQIEECVRPLVQSFGLDILSYQVLACLTASEGTLMLKDLSRQVRLDKAKQTRVLDAMEKRGLLLRARNHQDRRTATVSLTPEGRQMVRTMDHRLRRMPTRQPHFPVPGELTCLMKPRVPF